MGWVQFFLAESQSRLYPHMRAKFGCDPTAGSKKLPFNFISRLGVRSLANASRARQFNPLNPPGVGWVKFFKVRVSIRTCVPNLGAVRRERFLTIYNPLNPPGVRWVKFFFFFKVRVSAHACQILARYVAKDF